MFTDNDHSMITDTSSSLSYFLIPGASAKEPSIGNQLSTMRNATSNDSFLSSSSVSDLTDRDTASLSEPSLLFESPQYSMYNKPFLHDNQMVPMPCDTHINGSSSRFITTIPPNQNHPINTNCSQFTLSTKESSREHLTRKAKTIAIGKLPTRQPMPIDAREIACPQLPNVQVRIGKSSIPGAGLSLWLLLGPNNDGSADVGTRIATYGGQRYTSLADHQRLRDP